MPEKLRYGCVGAGGIADKKHLNEYSKLGVLEFAAICSGSMSSAERMAAKYGIKSVYTDYNEMFDKEQLDFISVCTPNYLHAPITIAALNKGINVHCEKPIAMNAEEAQEIVKVKGKSGKKVMVALNYRFSPETLFIKKYADAGLFGEIYHINCVWRRRNGIPGRGNWFTDRQLSGGGVLIDLGVHYLDLAMFFLGYPEISAVTSAVYSKFGNQKSRLRQGYKDKGEGIYDVEDMAAGFLKTQNNATIDFEFSWASNVEKEIKYIDIMGTKGGASYVNGELKIFSELLDTSVNLSPDFNGAIKPPSEFEHFINCVRNGTDPCAPPEDGLKLMKIIDAIYLSARN